jgi:glucose-6-phosphate 1-dehydrogenase
LEPQHNEAPTGATGALNQAAAGRNSPGLLATVMSPPIMRLRRLAHMVPNHLFQLLAMIGMEPPISFDADAVRAKKTELFQAIHPISPANAVRGQYGAGVVLGRHVPDYRHEPDVAPDSKTETYVALKLGIDKWRWAGVPFYLRTGKCLSARTTEIAVQFRQAPYALFRATPVEHLPPNILRLRIQPMRDCHSALAPSAPAPRSKSTALK